MYRLSPGSPSLNSTAPRGASKVSNSPASASTSSGSTPWNSPARRRISSTCAPRSRSRVKCEPRHSLAGSLVACDARSARRPGRQPLRSPAAAAGSGTGVSAESVPSRTKVSSLGLLASSRNCLDLALDRDLAQRLLDPAHEHDEAQQHEREQQQREADHGGVIVPHGRRTRDVPAASEARRRLVGVPKTEESPLALTRRARRINRELAALYPDAHFELDFTTPLELSVATILSAQCTDKRVNEVTPAAVREVPHRRRLRRRRPRRLETLIKPTGFFRNKTTSIIKLGQAARRALRRRGAAHARRAGHAARVRPQDGQRRARQRVRRPGPHRRHPLRPARAPLGLDGRDRPGQGRARSSPS